MVSDQGLRTMRVLSICFLNIAICFVFVFSGFFILKIHSILFQIEGSVVVFLLTGLCQVCSQGLSSFFPSLCYQRQLGIFNQPWPLLVPAPHRVFAWDMCWAPPSPQHRLRLWKLQRVRVFCNPNWDAGLEKEVNYGWQEKEAEHTTLYHLSFLTSWAQQGRSVLVFLAAQ